MTGTFTKPATVVSPTESPFAEKFLIYPKLMFFCIGVISFCLSDPSSTLPRWRAHMMPLILLILSSIIGSLILSIITDKYKMYRSMLAIIGIALPLLATFYPLQEAVQQDFYSLLPFHLLYVFQYFFLGGLVPIANALTLGKITSTEQYGAQHAFAPLGYLCFALLFAQFPIMDFSFNYNIMLFFSIIFLVALYKFDVNADVAGQYQAKEQTQYKKDQSSPFKRLFTEPRFIILFIGLLISGFNSSYVKVTFKAFINSLADEDYSIKLMKNETLYLSCIFDAAVYFSHKQMIQSFGTNWMFAIGHGLLVLRTLGFYFITPGDDVPKKVFLFDITQGIISGLITLTSVQTAADLASNTVSATSQSIFNIAHTSLASFVVFFVSVIELTSIRTIYVTTSVLGIIILIIIGGFLDELFPRKSNPKSLDF